MDALPESPASSPWWLNRMMSFDTETTDREPTVARLVTASICWVGGGDQMVEKSWLANSDVPIPEETTRIHGMLYHPHMIA